MTDHADERKHDELAATRMSFGDHLTELRSRLIKSLLAALVGFILVWIEIEPVMNFVRTPYETAMEEIGGRTAFVMSGVGQGFFAYMKVAFIVGLIGAGPFVIWQIWAFVGAGLYRHERRLVYRYFPLCVVLFLGGVAFGYWVLLPIGLEYLLGFTDPAIVEPFIGLSEYLSFFALMTLLLGAAFQLPVVMIGLARAGIVSIERFRRIRKVVIVVIFVVAAIVTPPDPFTQSLLAVPLVILYEFGIYLSWATLGKARPPVDWKVARRRGAKVLAFLLVLFLLREPLLRLWRKSHLAERVASSEHRGPDVAVAAERLLGEDILGVYRISEEAWPGRWVALGRTLVAVLEGEKVKVKDQILDEKDGQVVIAHVPAGAPQYHVRRVAGVRMKSVAPALLEAIELGAEEPSKIARAILERLTGAGKGLDDEAALRAFREWFDRHADDVIGG